MWQIKQRNGDDRMNLVKNDDEYGEKLIKLDFPATLFGEHEDCEAWYNHCISNDMKFLKGSYGTLVNKDFNKYFKLSRKQSAIDEIREEVPDSLLDHTNLFKSKIFRDVYVLTSSPYSSLNDETVIELSKLNVKTGIFNPYFLNYSGFISSDADFFNPLNHPNYMFTFASTQKLQEIKRIIYEDLRMFYPFKGLLKRDHF